MPEFNPYMNRFDKPFHLNTKEHLNAVGRALFHIGIGAIAAVAIPVVVLPLKAFARLVRPVDFGKDFTALQSILAPFYFVTLIIKDVANLVASTVGLVVSAVVAGAKGAYKQTIGRLVSMKANPEIREEGEQFSSTQNSVRSQDLNNQQSTVADNGAQAPAASSAPAAHVVIVDDEASLSNKSS